MLVTQRKRQHLQLCSLSFLAPPPHNRTTWLPSPSRKFSLSYPNQSRHSSPPILPCLQSLPRLSITGHYFHSGRLPFRPAILSLEDAPLESFPAEEVIICNCALGIARMLKRILLRENMISMQHSVMKVCICVCVNNPSAPCSILPSFFSFTHMHSILPLLPFSFRLSR